MVNKNISKDNKQSSAIWGGRFDGKPSKIMENINASISFDTRLYKEDIFASIAHTKMLAKQNIITNKDNRDGFDNPLTDNIHEISPITAMPIGLLNA